MKRKVALICLATLAFSLAGCQSKTDGSNNVNTATEKETTESSDEAVTLTGKVTAIDGSVVILQLGNLPEMPAGAPGENGATPPEMPAGGPGSGGGGNAGFIAGEETAAVNLADAVILLETAEGTADGVLSDISVGDILVAELGENRNALSVTIKRVGGAPAGGPGGFGGSKEVTQGSAANIIDTDGAYSNETYVSTGDDENALRVAGAKADLDGITVNKDSGATSNVENGDFYGVNAALLATDGANVAITNAKIHSSAQNGNGVFSYGENTAVNISDSVITTEADNSGGIQTTGGGTMNAGNLQVTTSGNSSAAIRSDRGGGTVNVDGGSYASNGYNSPAVYSTANITVKNAKLSASNSEALVIEGKNSIALENCSVTGNMSDTKGSSSDINVHNVMIYQSMSGDADVGTSEFSMMRGSLSSNNGDMFYVTNTRCVITLSGVEIANNETDGYFLLASGNDASRGWGSAGSNGAQVEFTADGQVFDGDIAVDSISSLNMALKNNSVYTGSVNLIENGQGGSSAESKAEVTIDGGSVWNLTGNCKISGLTNHGTINFNGYEITLADGSVLKE